MMASRSPSRGSKPLQRGKGKKNPMMMYGAIVGGIVLLLVVVVVLASSGRKPAAAAAGRARRAATEATSSRSTRSRAAASAERREENKREMKRRMREERRRLRAAAKAARRAAKRRGGTGSRVRSSVNPTALRAIVTDEKTGTRYALVGERRYKAGDDVGGRKISSVNNDGVTVTYGTNSYSVKVGQPVY